MSYAYTCEGCGYSFTAKRKDARHCSAKCREKCGKKRYGVVPKVAFNKRSAWVYARQHSLWQSFLYLLEERRGVFWIRSVKTKELLFVGRSQAFGLAETIRHHVGPVDGELCKSPRYMTSKVEVSAVWLPGLGHAEALYRREIVEHRPVDVPGYELAEARRVLHKVRAHRDEVDHHAPELTNDLHKPAVDAVAAGEGDRPGGLPDRLQSLSGRLYDDVTETTPPGAIVLAEYMDHRDGDTFYRLGRLLENDRIASVFMYDKGKKARLPRGCLSVLIVGGAA